MRRPHRILPYRRLPRLQPPHLQPPRRLLPHLQLPRRLLPHRQLPRRLLRAFVMVSLVTVTGAQEPGERYLWDPGRAPDDARLEPVFRALDWERPAALPPFSEWEWHRSDRSFVPLQPLEAAPERVTAAVVARTSPEGMSGEIALHWDAGGLRGGERTWLDETGRSVERREVTGEGNLRSSERVFHRGDGTVRAVRQCGDGTCVTARFAPPAAAGLERITGDGLDIGIRFSSAARPEYIRTERGETVTEEFLTWRDGRLVERRIEDDEERRVTSYADGRPQLERIIRDGRTVETRSWTYDEAGRVLTRTTVRRNRREEERWVRDGDRLLAREERVNGELRLREVPLPGDSRVQRTHYRDGVAVLRELIAEGTLVEREILSQDTPR